MGHHLHAALSISTATLPDGMVMFPYSQALQASGGVAPFTWSVSAGSLPHNLVLESIANNSTAILVPFIRRSISFGVRATSSRITSASP
jgi:hypothetical protein